MNIKTGLEIFKNMWLIEPQAAISYLQTFEQFMQQENGLRFRTEEQQETKQLDKKIFFASLQKTVFAPVDLWSSEAVNFNGFDGAETVIIPIEGALMKNDYCGWAGTATLTNYFRLADQTKSVNNIILLADSPGGTVDGTANFADAVAQSQKKTIAVTSGMACSACYWIISGSDEIYATASTDIIGSIGTMVSWYDRTQYLEQNGIVLREFYATKSTDKNRAYRDANQGKEKLLVQGTLDPLNNEFISSVEQNRQGKINLKNEDVLTGKTYVAKDAIKAGLIDGIKSLDDVLKNFSNNTTKQNSFAMKEFKNILTAAQVQGVYEEETFFGLNEDQLFAVEQKMQADADVISVLQHDKQNLSEQVSILQDGLNAANENFANASAEIERLENEVAELKYADGASATDVSKETDEKEKTLPKTSVDVWFENLNK